MIPPYRILHRALSQTRVGKQHYSGGYSSINFPLTRLLHLVWIFKQTCVAANLRASKRSECNDIAVHAEAPRSLSVEIKKQTNI